LAKIQIENAAKSIDGVIYAHWSMKTGILELSLDSIKVNINKVHRTIARTGYDTRMYKARDRAYHKLPDSCKYERIPENKMIGKKKLFSIARVPALGIQF
jgi:periplasmic mercuric ion binding protein